MSEACYISVKEAAELLQIQERSVRKQISEGKLKAEAIKSTTGGRGGKQYEVLVTSLPPKVQKRFRANSKTAKASETKQSEKTFRDYTEEERQQ
ncbi:hypothetical protein P4U44_20095, partial [Alkalihalobacillus alcalophilus]|nr:hypothetical protein [Alkalihalobacillus alcalophilus]